MIRSKSATELARMTALALMAATLGAFVGACASAQTSTEVASQPEVAVAPAAPEPQAEPARPTAESLLDANVAAMGGAEAFAAIDSMVSRGTMEIVGTGISGTIIIYQKRPAMQRMLFEAAGLGRIVSGADGEMAWELSDMQGARLLEGSEKAYTLRSGSIDAPAKWRDLYTEVELTGQDEVDGKPCHTIDLTPVEGGLEKWCVDVDSGLVVRVGMKLQHPMGEIPVQTFLSDYREVGSVLVAHRLVQQVMMQQMATTITSVETNVDIPDETFALPEEIQELINVESE
jgi:outer membrane lipoprotein-sorting protein